MVHLLPKIIYRITSKIQVYVIYKNAPDINFIFKLLLGDKTFFFFFRTKFWRSKCNNKNKTWESFPKNRYPSPQIYIIKVINTSKPNQTLIKLFLFFLKKVKNIFLSSKSNSYYYYYPFSLGLPLCEPLGKPSCPLAGGLWTINIKSYFLLKQSCLPTEVRGFSSSLEGLEPELLLVSSLESCISLSLALVDSVRHM